MKKTAVAILITALFLNVCFNVFAAEDYYHIYDYSDILSSSQTKELEEEAVRIGDKYSIEVVIYITDSTGEKEPAEYAQEFYQNGCLDGGYSENGILLLLITEDASWYLYVSGTAEEMFASDVRRSIWTADISRLSDSDIRGFLKKTEDILKGGEEDAQQISAPAEIVPERITDYAAVLSDSERTQLLNKLNEISTRQKFDVVIVTVSSIQGKTAKAYGDDFYDSNDFGQGDNSDGILLLVDINARQWALSTRGFGIEAFSDADQQKIMESILPLISQGDYSKAFSDFASLCDSGITLARTNAQNNTQNTDEQKKDPLRTAGFSLAAGVLIAFIAVSIMKSSLKSVAVQRKADNYVRSGSMNLTSSREVFLFKTVTSKPKQDTKKTSTTNTSSSGNTHGGSSGKF